MAKVLKYLPDTPYGQDFFNIHTQIAETIFEIIKTEDISSSSFTLGLLGPWGSGKSLTIKILRDQLEKENNIVFIEFDVWKYVDTSLYRSILIDLENDLITKSANGKVFEKFKKGIKSDRGEKLFDLLYSHSEFTESVEFRPADILEKLITSWEKNKICKFFSFLILRPINVLKNVVKYIANRIEIVYFIVFVIFVSSIGYYFKSEIIDFLPFLKNEFVRRVIKFLITAVFALSALEFFKEFFKDFFKELLPKTNKNVIISSPPTFAQDQFESIFKNIVTDISENGNKKIVLVFDNIDRCEANITLQVLTGLKTFLDEKNCFYLIPCDDMRIKSHLQIRKGEDDYLDKIFQAYLRIPLIDEDNKIEFIEKCINQTEFDLTRSDTQKIIQILTLAYNAETPRQIKRFFNDFISYYKLATKVDPDKKFLLKDIGHFTFMISIKQKWPEVEETIIDKPNIFERHNPGVNEHNLPTECFNFIDSCISWIDLESNPTDFIYLKDSKQTGNNVQKIILNDVEYKLTNSLIKDITRLLLAFISQERYILLDRGIEKIKLILEKSILNKDDEHIIIDLFKIYIDFIVRHFTLINSISDLRSSESYLIRHSSFIVENVEKVNKLDVNKINSVQQNFVRIIKSEGYNETTNKLYKSFVSSFNLRNISLLFNNNTDIFSVIPFLENTDTDLILKICPISFLNSIATSLTFFKDESPLINLLARLNDKPALNDIRKTIFVKINEVLSTLHQQTSAHVRDQFLIDGINLLNNTSWEGKDKNSFDALIRSRIQSLINGGQIIWVKYLICAIKLDVENIDKYAKANNGLSQVNAFDTFIDLVPPNLLEQAMLKQEFCTQIYRIGSQQRKQSKILTKLSLQYLSDNSKNLVFDDTNWLIQLLDKSNKDNTTSRDIVHQYEKTLIEAYIIHNNALIFKTISDISALLTSELNREYLIEKAFEFYAQNISGYLEQIKIALGLITIKESKIANTLYNNYKIQLLSVDDNELFTSLYNKLSIENQLDYINRVLNKNLTELLGGGIAGEILTNIHSFLTKSIIEINNGALNNIASELLEPSRNEVNNVIGLSILKKIIANAHPIDGPILERMQTLRLRGDKSNNIKMEIENIMITQELKKSNGTN